MIKLSRIKVFVINLDRSTQRLAAIQAQLAPTQLEWQRVPAVDGRAIDVSSLPEVDEATYRRWQGKPLNPGQERCSIFGEFLRAQRGQEGAWWMRPCVGICEGGRMVRRR